jgi:type II secretory pathway component GspD/PulD (secretin)
MVNHGQNWGWRAAAVRLLVAPVVAAGVVAGTTPAARAQATGAMPRGAATQSAARNADPSDLLKMGRDALKAGQLDRALDFAAQADARNATGRWGLFDDTPESLKKDVAAARGKAGKVEADRLAAAAKQLQNKPAKTPGEKLAQLDEAYAMADKAVTLTGPSDFFDDLFGGDRPEKLKAEIDAARTKLRKSNPGVVSQAAATTGGKPGVRTAAATGKPADGSKIQQARGAGFPAPVVPNPGVVATKPPLPTFAQPPIAPSGAKTPVASTQMAMATPAAMAMPAPAMPAPATPTAVTPVVPVMPKPAPAGIAAAPVVPVMPNSEEKPATAGIVAIPDTPRAPVVPAAPVAPAVAAMPPAAPAVSGALGSAQLLDQARASLRSDDIEMARKLAAQAVNAGAKAEGAELLRLIDSEKATKHRKDSAEAFANACGLVTIRQYDQALMAFRLIDADALPAEQRGKHAEMVKECMAEVAKLKAAASPVTVVAMQEPARPVTPAKVVDGVTTPVAPPKAPADGGLAGQVRAMADADFQKYRSEGLEVESKAREAYQRGDTDVAIQMLTDFTNRVKASKLPDTRQAMLLDSVGRRLETFRIMKRQTDFYTTEAKTKDENRSRVAGKMLAESQKQDDIKRKVAEVNELSKKKNFREAEELALQLKTLDPDDASLNAIYELTKRQRRVDDYEKIKSNKEASNLAILNSAENYGQVPTDGRPLVFDPNHKINPLRGVDNSLYSKPMSAAEREIEVRLERPITVEFTNDVTLKAAIDSIREKTGLNITTDDSALAEDPTALTKTLVTENLKDLSLRNVLTILLDKANLKFVVQHDVIRITTAKKARGKLYTKVFSVMELVTPIPDFALAPHQNLATALSGGQPAPAWVQSNSGASSYQPRGGITNGELVSGQLPGAAPGGAATLRNDMTPMASSATLAKSGRANYSTELISAVKMLNPYAWDDVGGSGSIKYYDIGGALIVNQTADVIAEVQQLLESLRRLQEVSVSIEIRVMSLSESFFERIGVDFAMNVKTKQRGSYFEQALTTGQFTPEPFTNSLTGVNNVTVGYNPAQGGFTPDLNFPVRPSSFGNSLPPFGGYNGPSGSGGLGLGLAFLNDIQVYLFMEAAAGDRRISTMQAPKVTLFNGQTASIFVGDVSFFTTGLDVVNVGGQFVYIPRNTPIPIGNTQPIGVQTQVPGVSIAVQAIVSSDRRFVRMNLTPTLSSLTNATVPLFPVTAFITPVFEGGSQGVPIPFTQFFQQPQITQINVQTTVSCPDGGTVVLGGLKTLSEGRNEFGPPVLSQIPYINRLFRNQGIGRETRHIMIMVTPRIIIQSEEELNQTGTSGAAFNPR